jgi:hypothetical protein
LATDVIDQSAKSTSHNRHPGMGKLHAKREEFHISRKQRLLMQQFSFPDLCAISLFEFHFEAD